MTPAQKDAVRAALQSAWDFADGGYGFVNTRRQSVAFSTEEKRASQ